MGRKLCNSQRTTCCKKRSIINLLGEALHYFFESWFDVLHPTLIALSCEAVGGKKELTVKMGAAVVLLAGAADIHDDIMDKSLRKSLV